MSDLRYGIYDGDRLVDVFNQPPGSVPPGTKAFAPGLTVWPVTVARLEGDEAPKAMSEERLDMESIAASLHANRHYDSLMADWARKWGQSLIEEIERLTERRDQDAKAPQG